MDVVAFLVPRPRADVRRREAVVRALVVEAQRAPRGPWRTLLLVAFRPLLINLVGSIRGDAFAPDDLEQTVAGPACTMRSNELRVGRRWCPLTVK